MEQEVAQAWARYDDACSEAADQYIEDVKPDLETYHAALLAAKERLVSELAQIYRKEPEK